MFAVWFIAAGVASADQTNTSKDAPVVIEKVEVGFSGWSKVGEWTPVWVTLHAVRECRVQVVVDSLDPDDSVAAYSGPEIELQEGTITRIERAVRSGRLQGDLLVRVMSADGTKYASERIGARDDSVYRPAMKLASPLWITLGKFEIGSSAEGESDRHLDDAAPRIVHLASPNELPLQWRSLQSIDLLILPTGRAAGGDASLLANMTADRSESLREWVLHGGHLVISVAAEVAQFENSPFKNWGLPISIEGQTPIRQLSNLESYAGPNSPIRMSGVLSIAQISKADPQQVLVRDAVTSHPLIVSMPFGFGRVTIAALDFDAPPLAGWQGMYSVLRRVVGTETGKTRGGAKQSNRQLTHVGVSDLATQLHQTHESFPQVSRPSFWSVMGLMLIYVAVIGPLDYFFVHRILRRPELTWFSFALLAVVGVAGAAFIARHINSRGLLVNQFNLIDIDVSSATVHNTTWASLYSDEHRRYSVSIEPKAPSAGLSPVEIGWLAPPETSIGGMYRAGVGGLGGRHYRFSPDRTAIENLPIAQWSTKSLSADWTTSLEKPPVQFELDNLGTGQLRGTLTNLLDEPLEDCMLVANGWAYIPMTAKAALQPKAVWNLRGDARIVLQRDLKALLTGEKQTRRRRQETGVIDSVEITTVNEAYQPLSRDRSQQVSMLSFHEATGGSAYTGMSNAALRNLELTQLMNLGRAVLIGKINTSPARVVVDGKPVDPSEQAVWVRIILPVVSKERILEKVIPKAHERKVDQIPRSGDTP